MTLQELVDEIDRQPAWENQGTRAPHKPLTILYAIGQALAGRRMMRYADAAPELEALLDQFGPPREVQHPEQPVWRLRQYNSVPTSFWDLDGPLAEVEGPGGNPRVGVMRDKLSFGLSEDAARILCENPANAHALAAILAAKIAPPTLEADLLEAVGVGETAALGGGGAQPVAAAPSPVLVTRAVQTVSTLVRNPAFARKVRMAYEGSCAICSIAPRLENKLFGLEAAHIRWANAGGPDEVHNGILLCRMHHHALDRGAIKVDQDMKVRISPKLARDPRSDEVFARFDGEEIRLPKPQGNHPHREMLEWHWREVFKG
jgi:putative restriction endonuclease